MVKIENVFIMDHPLIKHKISMLRDKNTGTNEFRKLVEEIGILMGYEALRDLPTEEVEIETPIETCKTPMISGKKLAVIPVLRAGLGMVNSILTLVPSAKVGHVGLYRDPVTHEPHEYYCKLPESIDERISVIVDPMLATGGSAEAAIDFVKKQGGKNIKFMVDGNELNAWETVIYYCDQLKVMNYKLESEYETNFSIFNEPSVENIFTIPMNKTLYTNQMQYLFRSRHYNHAKAYGLSGENGPSATIEALETFGYGTAAQDPRFDICYFAGEMYDLKGDIIKLDDGTVLVYLPWEVALDITDTPYEQTAGARMKKYEVDPTVTKDGKLMENDIVLFRYADALLMKSEAKVRNGENGDVELNQVRSRVKAARRPATLENILSERQLELAWEGWRRQDLIRFGMFTRAYNSRPQLPNEETGYTTVFPIPEKIRVMNTKLVQNPGY